MSPSSQLQTYHYERNFLDSIRSKASREIYSWLFNKYRQYVVNERNNDVIGDPKIIESQVIDFLLSLKQRGLLYNTIKGYFVAIVHFYDMNDIVLNKKKIIKFINIDERKPRNRNQGYTSEQIHKLLDICDERTQAIILIYISTGIRLAALPLLRYGDLKLTKIADFDSSSQQQPPSLYEITVYQGYKEEYTTFCTPECTNVINSYLEYRTRSGEILKADSPLIREQFDASNSFKVKYPRAIGIQTIAKILTQKMVQAGIRQTIHVGSREGPKKRKEVALIHGFRKFFNTALMNADVHPTFKELLMGHTIRLDDVYYHKDSKKSREKLLDEYCKAIDALTINEENRLRIKVKELTDIQTELTSKNDEIEYLKEQIREFQPIRDQVKELSSMITDLGRQIHEPSSGRTSRSLQA